MAIVIYREHESRLVLIENLINGYRDMTPDRRTDGRRDGRTRGQHQIYIPPPSVGDKTRLINVRYSSNTDSS